MKVEIHIIDNCYPCKNFIEKVKELDIDFEVIKDTENIRTIYPYTIVKHNDIETIFYGDAPNILDRLMYFLKVISDGGLS